MFSIDFLGGLFRGVTRSGQTVRYIAGSCRKMKQNQTEVVKEICQDFT